MLDDYEVDGWTTVVVDHAASVGSLEAVEYLHLNRDEGCTTHVMDKAAANGHLDVVVFLHGHRSEGCTAEAMDGTAAHGALDVIQYLHHHRTEGCTMKAMEDAALNNYGDVVDFLLGHYDTPITSKGVNNAAEAGDLTILIKILERSPAVGGGELLCAAARGGHSRILTYLLDSFIVKPHEIGASLVEAAKNGRFMVVKRSHPRVSDADVICDAVDGATGIGDVDIVALLLSSGKPFRSRTGEGWVRAAALGSVQLIEMVEDGWDTHALRSYRLQTAEEHGREWVTDEDTTWYIDFRTRQLLAAARGGHAELLDSLWPKLHTSMRSYIVGPLEVVGNVDVFCYLHLYRRFPVTTEALMRAVWFGLFCVLKLHYEHRREEAFDGLLLDAAAEGGSLDAVRSVHCRQCARDTCTTNAMDAAAARGFLDIVRFLHHNQTEGCTTAAMDQAASGQLTTLRFLHQHRTEGCTSAAMDNAARVGALSIVRFLHEHRTEGCTTAAMDAAASNGHLHAHRSEGCRTRAMDGAARHGHLVVVKFLHEYRHEGCTTAAMDGAAANFHLTIVQYLHRNRTEGCTIQALVEARRSGHCSVVKYLDTRYDGRYAAARGGDESKGEIMEDTSEVLTSPTEEVVICLSDCRVVIIGDCHVVTSVSNDANVP